MGRCFYWFWWFDLNRCFFSICFGSRQITAFHPYLLHLCGPMVLMGDVNYISEVHASEHTLLFSSVLSTKSPPECKFNRVYIHPCLFCSLDFRSGPDRVVCRLFLLLHQEVSEMQTLMLQTSKLQKIRGFLPNLFRSAVWQENYSYLIFFQLFGLLSLSLSLCVPAFHLLTSNLDVF